MLTKHNTVDSLKDAYGRFEIDTNQMKQVKISKIVFAINRDSIYNGCAPGLSTCDTLHPCPMPSKFSKTRNELKNMLGTISVLIWPYKLRNEVPTRSIKKFSTF